MLPHKCILSLNLCYCVVKSFRKLVTAIAVPLAAVSLLALLVVILVKRQRRAKKKESSDW